MTKESKSSYRIIGGMAGSSMDGLDLVEAVFFHEQGEWSFEVLKSETFLYDEEIFNLLKSAKNAPKEDQNKLDEIFGRWIAERVKTFGCEKAELIAVHGHTLIHKPDQGISWQLGRGDVIANLTKRKALTNFRTKDVLLGGQGAPLVPMGDFELFKKFDACLNLGGIANVSIRSSMLAWDVCPCNQILNHFANKLGKPFDSGGKMASRGEMVPSWYEKIAAIAYFHLPPPKSLPNEFIDDHLLEEINAVDGLKTYTQFIRNQLISDLSSHLTAGSQVLITGGGALNTYLIDILNRNDHQFEFLVPEEVLVHFKEAIIFAFLGLLRVLDKPNVLASVTGASQNSCSGEIHFPE
ncbi:MAG: anhydro-N-acetylmuramic acid kinase [Bacteroidota bacterium]